MSDEPVEEEEAAPNDPAEGVIDPFHEPTPEESGSAGFAAPEFGDSGAEGRREDDEE